MRPTMLLFLTSAFVACATPQAETPRVRVLVLSSGDDGLTGRLAEAIRHGLQDSRGYASIPIGEPPDLVISIESNVRPTFVEDVMYANYDVRFYRPIDYRITVGRSAGGCRAQRVEDCAETILRDFYALNR